MHNSSDYAKNYASTIGKSLRETLRLRRSGVLEFRGEDPREVLSAVYAKETVALSRQLAHERRKGGL